MRRSAILVGLMFFLLGCDEDASVFDVKVSSINGGGPLQADLLKFDRQLQQYFIPEDVVTVAFTNKAKNGAVVTDPGSFLNDFQLQRYTVTWRRADGGPTSGAGWSLSNYNFEAATSALIPINTTTDVGILLAPAGMKSQEPFATALATGTEIQLIADIDFIGTRAVASDAEIHVPASLSVNFADFADKQ